MPTHLRAIDGEEAVEGALGDVERGQVRQEVVAHQEGHEHEVVDHALQRNCDLQQIVSTNN